MNTEPVSIHVYRKAVMGPERLLRLCAYALVFFCGMAAAEPSPPVQIQPVQLLAPPAAGFAASVEVSGDWMFAGVPTVSTGPRGETHVFRKVRNDCEVGGRRCWEWHSRVLQTPELISTDSFGASIEYDGRTLLVGAPGDGNANNGRVLAYRLEGDRFVLQQVLSAPDAEPRFGHSISLDGNQVAITTANFFGTGVFGTGAVYLFERQGEEWVYTDRISTQNGPTEQFGFAVDLRGNQIIVGANEGNYAVIFRRQGNAWLEQRIMSPGTGSFGLGVEIQNKEAFVSAHGDISVSNFVRDRRSWCLVDAFRLPIDPTSFPPSPVGGPLQLQGKSRLFAGGAEGVYLFESQLDGWRMTARFVTPNKVAFGTEELMDVRGRWLAALDGGLIHVFDLRGELKR